MSGYLFQQTVLKKRMLASSEKIREAYKIYAAYFHNPEIQENIRNSKEEQFQEGFLRELFVKILGYTLNPEPNYNLITEKKNETDSKKADGAIIINGEVKAVIELKDHKTTDLKQVEAQAFGYKNNNRKTSYVIISNFEKLRFYIENTIDFEEFNLFELMEDDFAVLWICLAYENIVDDLPKRLKNESTNNEDHITKKLYKDYSSFKQLLFENIQKNNPEFDRLELFRKTQKLLDRFLFVFFAEDKGLLPPNSMKRIIDQWDKRNEDPLNEYQPLYGRFKLYFKYMNEGHKGKTEDIFGYNGGLFKPDEILEAITIDDDVLKENILKLVIYDFDTEVDVNILGHIFENSLSEIEEITNQLKDNTATISKRKKDGVFYTPRYITTYIVENTLGKLCADKKTELKIDESEYVSDKKRLKTQTKQLSDKLTEYREWLLSLTICDPACGSGAFLNAALDFLMSEHRYIDELTAKLFGNAIVFPNIENAILENNLYGVDINEESVEIAKLALWLRTAKPNRKLNSLNNNIKCGNSLISDPEVAGEKAFEWHKEFPQVFEKGGFDVVIGNPPYGIIIDANYQEYYAKHYPLTRYKTNLYVLFIERMLQLFNNSIVHFIIPKSLLFNSSHEDIRKGLLLKTEIQEIFTITEKVFEDAEVGGSLLLNFIVKKNPDIYQRTTRFAASETIEGFVSQTDIVEKNVPQSYFLNTPNCEITVTSQKSQSILNKLCQLRKISDFYNLKNGLNPGNVKHVLISTVKTTEKYKPIIWGKEITQYGISWTGSYINYDENINKVISIENVKSKKGMNKQERIDFALRTPDLFEVKKIVIRKTGDTLIACLDENNFYFDTLVHGIYEKEKAYSLKSLLAIINSKPATFFYRLLHDIKGKVFAKISLDNLASFPIPEKLPMDLAVFADKMLSLNSDLQTKRQRFLKRLSDNFISIKITGTLERFNELEFKQFLTELAKHKITLSLKQQDEWEEYFNEYKTECTSINEKLGAITHIADNNNILFIGGGFGYFTMPSEEYGNMDIPKKIETLINYIALSNEPQPDGIIGYFIKPFEKEICTEVAQKVKSELEITFKTDLKINLRVDLWN